MRSSPSTARPRPWWQTSLIAGVSTAAFLALLIVVPIWPWGVLLLATGAGFLWTLLHNPEYRFTRLAGACLGLAASCLVVPNVDLGIQLGPQTFGYLLMDSAGSGWIGAVALLAAAFFGYLDFRKSGAGFGFSNTRRADHSNVASGQPATQALAHGDHATAVGGNLYIAPVTVAGPDTALAEQIYQWGRKQAATEAEQKLRNLGTQLESEQGQRRSMEAAIARVRHLADGGSDAARAAIEEARRSGEPAKLLAVLRSEADRQEQRVSEFAADYIELCREIAAVAFVRGDIDEAERRLTSILRLLPDDLDAINRSGQIHKLRGQLPEAESCYKRVLALATEQSWRAIACGNLGLIYRTRGDLDEAERMLRKALAINEKLGRLEGMANQYGNLGSLSAQRGDTTQARELWTKSRDLFQRIGMKRELALVQEWLDALPPEGEIEPFVDELYARREKVFKKLAE